MADIKTSLGEDSVKLDEHMVMDFKLARVENMAMMEPEKEDMANIFILGVEAGPIDKEIKKNENNVFKTNIPEDIKLQEHLDESGQLLDEHHLTHQVGQQVGDTQVGGGHNGYVEGAGGQEEHGVDDELSDTETSTTLQLVRRNFRLRAGIRRDGLLQPTVTNFFVTNSGRGAAGGSITKTGSGIKIKKQKYECTALQNDGQAKRRRTGSHDGQI